MHHIAKKARYTPAQAPEIQDRCLDCGRFHVRGKVCLFCHPPLPERCQCDIMPVDRSWALIPDAHRHILHALLELLYQQALEGCDEWILGPSDVVKPAPRPRWWENTELLPHLAKHPTLVGLLRTGTPGDCQAVYDWAGVRTVEAIAFELHLIGWIDEAIAQKMQEKNVSVVCQWYSNAEARIRAAMEFSDLPEAM